MPPVLAQLRLWMWEIWLELAGVPVSLIVTVNESLPLTTWPVPETPLLF
jgi:hypothetical protein